MHTTHFALYKLRLDGCENHHRSKTETQPPPGEFPAYQVLTPQTRFLLPISARSRPSLRAGHSPTRPPLLNVLPLKPASVKTKTTPIEPVSTSTNPRPMFPHLHPRTSQPSEGNRRHAPCACAVLYHKTTTPPSLARSPVHHQLNKIKQNVSPCQPPETRSRLVDGATLRNL